MKGLFSTHIMSCTDGRYMGQLLRERNMPSSCGYGFVGNVIAVATLLLP